MPSRADGAPAGASPDVPAASGPATDHRARLDTVRITATFVGADVHRAVRVLALPTAHCGAMVLGEQRGDRYLPDRLPLLDAGVEIQLREVAGGEQAVAMLRPCRRVRLTDRWLAFHAADSDELLIEAEWAGERTSLAARMTASRPAGAVGGRFVAHGPSQNPLSPRQAAFLADCADAAVEPAALRWLGPIELLTWQPIGWNGLDLTAERWTVPSSGSDQLDLLVLSLRVEPQAAEVRRLGFETLLRRCGLDPTATESDAIRQIYQTLIGLHGFMA